MSTVVITGANRGIGLALVKHFLKMRHKVYACCRTPSDSTLLFDLLEQYPKTLNIEKLDISSTSSIDLFCHSLQAEPIDILINNASVTESKKSDMTKVSQDEFLDIMNINCYGTLYLSQSMLPMLKKSQRKRIVSLSSRMASISINLPNGYYGYRASKAALNGAMRGLAVDNEIHGIQVLLLHPGEVQTRMTGFTGSLSPDECCVFLYKQITCKQHFVLANALINFDGSIIQV